MFSVAVIIAICTVHRKPCIALHNVRKLEKKLQNSVIQISRNQSDEFAKVSSTLVSCLTIRRNYSTVYLFVTQLRSFRA